MRKSGVVKHVIKTKGEVDYSELVQRLASEIRETLGVDMVTLWRMSPGADSLTCEGCSRADRNDQLIGSELYRARYPLYFDALLTSNLIQAVDVYKHASLRELVDGYLRPNGIVSLFDYVLFNGLTPVLVVCCETTEQERHWSYEDTVTVKDILMFARPYLLKRAA